MKKITFRRAFLTTAFAAMLGAISSAHGAFSEIYSFPITPQAPNAGLVQATNGDFYGASTLGGTYSLGTIYRITASGTLSVIYSFDGTNGNTPNGSLIQAADGYLYGTASAGGDTGNGTIFRISTNGIFTNLHSFTGDDGAQPAAGLSIGANGIMYGTTAGGGANGPGALFSITTNGVFTLVGSFDFDHGYNPSAGVIQGADGNFYGTTDAGGDSGNGTVYVMGADGVFTNVYSFDGTTGSTPGAALVETAPGVFYGTTTGGGANDKGTIFVVNQAGGFTNLVSFDESNGATPHARLLLTADGTLYGTTFNGGPGNDGTVFKLSASGVFTSLASFNLDNGANPFSELTLGNDGQLYGTTVNGRAGGFGTVFKISTNGAFSSMASFTALMGASPHAGLTDNGNGKFYGTTYFGGTNNYGLFFSVTAGGSVSPLFSFGLTNGAYPAGKLLLASNGNFYGTTTQGGTNGLGTIFEIATNGTLMRSISLTTNIGSSPQADLVFGQDGYIYGTAAAGGTSTYGTVFKMSPAGVLSNLYSFNIHDGYFPYGGLLCDSNGDFYGTTYSGGEHFVGVLYKINSNGVYTVLAPFDNSNGANPQACLIQKAGVIYGTASTGGDFANGTIFQYPPGGPLTAVASFNGNNGATPVAALVAGTDGNFYGTASAGGFYNSGTAYRMTPDGSIVALATFSGFDGAGPVSSLVQATNGDLFSVSSGGSQGNGNIFKVLSLSVSDPPLISTQPASVRVNGGASPTFHVVAASLTALGYQWRFGTNALSASGHYVGVQSDTLTVANATVADVGSYFVVVTNAAGASSSQTAVLTVIARPVITVPPTNISTNISATATFHVAGTGGELAYLWKHNNNPLSNGGDISGADTDTLTLSNVQNSDGGSYTVTLSNSQGVTGSTPVFLTIYPPPTITSGPNNTTNNAGETGTFRVNISSPIPVTYQWFKGTTSLNDDGHFVGTTNSTLSLVGVNDSDVDNYSVVVANASGSATSGTATFSIIDIPSITQQPDDVTTNAGTTVTFHVADSGPSSVYHWRKGITPLSNGGIFSGVTTPTLTLTGIFAANDGSYSVVITNTAGSTQSVAAVLFVADPFINTQPADQAVNRSTQAVFHVVATGTSLTYQWRTNGINLANNSKFSGVLSSNLTVSSVQQTDVASYSVIVTGPNGPLASADARLSVVDVPTIVTQAVSVVTNAGSTARFHVEAEGLQIVYQWLHAGTNLIEGGRFLGTTNATLTLNSVTAQDEGSYNVHITNSVASVDSTNVTLTVNDPFIAIQPVSRTNNEATVATFSVTAYGSNLGYQWRSNSSTLTDGGQISGATTSVLTISGVIHADTASYSVVVTGAKAPVTSSNATLAVIDIPTVATSPVSVATNAGSTVHFQAKGIGAGLSYQWRHNNTNLTEGANVIGSSTTNLTLLNVIATDAGSYLAHISNVAGSVDTAMATLSVTDPYIKTSPVSKTVNAGTTGVLSVVASGTSLAYQWFSNNVPMIDGGTVTGSASANLSIGNLVRSDSATYFVQVSNTLGTLTTTNIVMTVMDPAINTQPQDAGVNINDNNIFSVDAGGTPTLRYQWYYSNATTRVIGKILGQTNTTLTISGINSTKLGGYRVVVTNQLPLPNAATSKWAKLFFNIPPAITVNPAALTKVPVGAKVTLTAGAKGTQPFSYKWLFNGSPLAGQTTNKLVLTNLQVVDSGTYQLFVTNASGSTATTLADHGVLFVTNVTPHITRQPANYNIIAGNNATFSVGVSGTPPFYYQWSVNGTPIPGANSSNLVFTNVTVGTNFYACTVTNPAPIPAVSDELHGILKCRPDTNSPVISVAFPLSGMRLTNNTSYSYGGVTSAITPQVIFSGSVTDNGLITNVTIRRTFPLTQETPVQAQITQTAPGKIKFTNVLSLIDGTNTFVVTAQDQAGNISHPYVRTVFYVNNTTLLMVLNNGNGATIPVSTAALHKPPYPYGAATNEAYLEIGRGYRIKAIPGANSIFTNWTDGHGIVLTTNVQLTFVMSSNLVLNANFLTNPIIAAGVNGSYNGLFYGNTVEEDSAGFVYNINVGTNRTFSGKLAVAGLTNTLTGTFDLTGNAHAVISRASKSLPNLDVSLHLDWQLDTKQITGTVSNIIDGGWSSSLLADLAVFSTNNPYAVAARYTMVIPPAATAPDNSPGGAGYAVITNNALGKSTLVGKLADNTGISLTLPISKDGFVPFYQNLYSHQGLILGWLAYPTDTESGDVFPTGVLTWIRPANAPSVSTYVTGFTNTVSVLGSAYVPQAPVLSAPVTTLDITDGNGLGLPLSYTVHFNTNNALIKTAPANALSASVSTTTGVLTATFSPTGHPSKTAYGVILQNLNAGYGYFIASTNNLGQTNSGLIHLH